MNLGLSVAERAPWRNWNIFFSLSTFPLSFCSALDKNRFSIFLPTALFARASYSVYRSERKWEKLYASDVMNGFALISISSLNGFKKMYVIRQFIFSANANFWCLKKSEKVVIKLRRRQKLLSLKNFNYKLNQRKSDVEPGRDLEQPSLPTIFYTIKIH